MTRLFLPQPNGYPHSHCASVIEHKKRLYCCWYSYKSEEYIDARLFFSSFERERKEWSTPAPLGGPISRSQGNPTLYSFKNKLYLFFVTLEDQFWNSAKLYHGEIDLHRQQLCDLRHLGLPLGTMVRHSPLINEEKLLLAAYDEKTLKTILFQAKLPLGELEKLCELEGEGIQGDIISLEKDDLLMVLRATEKRRKVLRAHSPDNAQSFPFIYHTPFECPLSGVAARKLNKEFIVVAHNDTAEHKRSPLNLSFTKDHLKSIHQSIVLEEKGKEFSYPALFLDSQSCLHVVYTHERERIAHQFFRKNEWIQFLEGGF